jgi:WD40 repeat protein
VKAWSPHDTVASEPSIIGTHEDYVRCLTLCRTQGWVASGSFDRTIKLWDLSRSSSDSKSESDPLLTMNPPDGSGPKSSVYALAADPFGHCIASGSPERVVRLWDPRSGKRTAKLVGHTDNIRCILVSDDARYVRSRRQRGTAFIHLLIATAADGLERCVHQAVVARVATVPAYVHASHGVCLVAPLCASIARGVLFRRPRGPALPNRRRGRD